MDKKPNSVHTPFKPARKDLAEICFLNQWRTLNEENPNFLANVLGQSRFHVRQSRVAASFITWIGTNCGASFVAMAKSAVEHYEYPEPAYLAAWALMNRRRSGVSFGVRIIESILSTENLVDSNPRGTTSVRLANVHISLADIDVVEALVVWLSTSHGDAFVSSCQLEYDAMRAIERSKNNLRMVSA